jgi:hypothetical protein
MKNHGPCVYFDTSIKNDAKKKPHNRWRADITIGGRRYRKRGANKAELEAWLESIKRI